MIKVDNLSFRPNYNDEDIIKKLSTTLKLKSKDIDSYVILKKSIDARRKPDIKIILSLGVNLNKNINIKGYPNITVDNKGLTYIASNYDYRPVVVGFGPSGMFCALALCYMGYKPIVVEQGLDVDARTKMVEEFWNTGKLNPKCNVQFGEGGAGTFSDGKLNTNLNNSYCKVVINEFVLNGAPKEIAYINKPHIGSDNLKVVVKNIRERIVSMGGEVRFNTQFVDYVAVNDTISRVFVKNLNNNKIDTIDTKSLALCIGHSARDTFRLLYDKGLELKQKPFAMGVRIEQSQEKINLSQYGILDPHLPPADYKLAVHLPNGRSVFTFCMCPGGVVVNSASNNGEVVTNGMSYFARNLPNANSAVLVNVVPEDYGSTHPLAGIEFQSKYEQLAYSLTMGKECPAQTVGSFLGHKDTALKIVPSTAIKMSNISQCLPDFVTQSLKEGLPLLNDKLKGFSDDGNLLIAIESRSSSPVTIVRDDTMQTKIKGLYPCGAGAGYAGGIISSAVDGIKVAEAIRDNDKN